MSFFSVLFEICYFLYIPVQFAVPIVASFQDIKYGRVNNFLLWGGTAFMLLNNTLTIKCCPLPYLLGFVILTAVFFITWIITKRKLGLADVYFASFAGACLLTTLSLVIFVGASILCAGLFYLGAFVFRRIKYKKGIRDLKIPFIPFLSVGFFAAFFLHYYSYLFF